MTVYFMENYKYYFYRLVTFFLWHKEVLNRSHMLHVRNN